MAATTHKLIAGGTIRPCRFIKLSTTENHTALEADANELVIGISMEGTQDAPGLGGSTDAANDGDEFEYHPLGDECLLELDATGCTAGDALKSDADGKGDVVDGNNDKVGAIALETGAAGEKVRVLVWRYVHGA